MGRSYDAIIIPCLSLCHSLAYAYIPVSNVLSFVDIWQGFCSQTPFHDRGTCVTYSSTAHDAWLTASPKELISDVTKNLERSKYLKVDNRYGHAEMQYLCLSYSGLIYKE